MLLFHQHQIYSRAHALYNIYSANVLVVSVRFCFTSSSMQVQVQCNHDHVSCLPIGGRAPFLLGLDLFSVLRGGSEFWGREANMFWEVSSELGRDEFPWKKESKRNLNVSIIFKIFECMGKIEKCLVTRMKYYTSINYFDVYNKLPKLVYIMNINWNLI